MNCHKKVFPAIIARILAHTKESRASLCKRTGISKTSLSDFLGGRKDLSFDAVIALVNAFPSYNARWLLTGVKSQTMIGHQKKLDAGKLKKLPPAIYPSDDVVITRFKDFCSRIDVDIVNLQHGTELANAYTTSCDLKIKDGYTYCNDRTAHGALMKLITLYSANELVYYKGNGPLNYITAPNFFAPL